MRTSVLEKIVGRFLQIYAAVILAPVAVGVYYSEPLVTHLGFIVPSVTALFVGTFLSYGKTLERPTVIEGITATVLGWVMAILLGAIPFQPEMTMVNAVFESTAGLTTTGISMLADPAQLSNSVLFWRSFMQWLGGLGILTFFIVVLRESGGVARQLYSAESHKTDSGSIRPSLGKSIADLWKVYGLMTVFFGLVYYVLGMPFFDSILHVFSGISTGGFSTNSESIAAYSSVPIEVATIFLMLCGGMNFVLAYKGMKGELKQIIGNAEFRWYIGGFLIVSSMVSLELISGGSTAFEGILDGAFQTAALISSTGYSTMAITSFSVFLQTLFIGVMFVGGSLGSTSGGLKIFRLRVMVENLKLKLRSYRLPNSALNKPVIDGQIIGNSMIRTISVLFFAWILLVFIGTLILVLFEDISFMTALSGSVSSAGNMGPVYMAEEQMVELSTVSKITWMFLMVAGRLEMLPVLAIFNSQLFKDSK